MFSELNIPAGGEGGLKKINSQRLNHKYGNLIRC